ncbi:hypothetical protein ZEAMMB73_Zm00001d035388 [Zea mays]|uniref:DUF6857 domain-containing protein n=1 Tax=Zea mays TaxID=4577 RepID=A0A1D6LG89_MAIZE|nr:hypothetical protein ZEAMMB73_Zm00001d035388 [Zea mays]
MQPPGKQPPPRIPYLQRTATGSQHNAGVRADVVRLGSGEGADYCSSSAARRLEKVKDEAEEAGKAVVAVAAASWSFRLRSLRKSLEGEQVAAGWPLWLSAVAGEAIQGWIPLKADSFEKLDKLSVFNLFKLDDSGFESRRLSFRKQETTGLLVVIKPLMFDSTADCPQHIEHVIVSSCGGESTGIDANGNSYDLSTKLLHLAWHPSENLIACATANSLYIKFTEICASENVYGPLPTVDLFLSVYGDMMQWKDIAESVASAELSATEYWTKNTTKETAAQVAKDLCGEMQRWFLAFVEDALHVDGKWKHSINTPTLVSQLNKISGWLEEVEHEIVEEEWMKKIGV